MAQKKKHVYSGEGELADCRHTFLEEALKAETVGNKEFRFGTGNDIADRA